MAKSEAALAREGAKLAYEVSELLQWMGDISQDRGVLPVKDLKTIARKMKSLRLRTDSLLMMNGMVYLDADALLKEAEENP